VNLQLDELYQVSHKLLHLMRKLNFLSTELVARNIKLFYWKGKRNSELEFLVNVDSHVILFDVKKGKSSLNSLSEYRCRIIKDLAIKVSSNQYGYDSEQKLLTLPFYYVPFYLDMLQKGVIIDE